MPDHTDQDAVDIAAEEADQRDRDREARELADNPIRIVDLSNHAPADMMAAVATAAMRAHHRGHLAAAGIDPAPPAQQIRLAYRRWVSWVEFPPRGGFVIRRKLVTTREYAKLKSSGRREVVATDGTTDRTAIYGLHILPCGGEVTATIMRGKEVVARGVSKCSVDDNFSRRIARDIAIGRMVLALRNFRTILDAIAAR